ncbi:uncharacterized protein LOC134211838 isoform X2 [Armigeres subalbatus]|uniref:uncharacterized protein LOC134211838 isoform X2 n=1 Tax=Armigeres subalbatus TaxID=124917 RepID=UPI002ED08A26
MLLERRSRCITKNAITMHNLACTICSIIITAGSVIGENDYFPDAREAPEFMKTINEIIEERARQRFLEHWQRLQLNRNILQRTEASGPAFTYQSLPPKPPANPNDPIDFAVGPSDSRFYDRTVSVDLENAYNSDNIHSDKISNREFLNRNPNRNLPPSPQDIKPKLPIHYNEKSLDNKLRRKEHIFDENLLPQRVNGVIQRPVDMDGAVAMYIVALIGGISAAVTVGLISVGIGWYTLHKKAKAAADVDYPAYGVTGPNKDSSPTGDRRLAQSAQMYHYQHQKQQIIAMENHNNIDKNGIHSDAESEDDNEEGDYTVYECPGLAPTGEMEVKNPLFLEDTTLTPGANQIPTTTPTQTKITIDESHSNTVEEQINSKK